MGWEKERREEEGRMGGGTEREEQRRAIGEVGEGGDKSCDSYILQFLYDSAVLQHDGKYPLLLSSLLFSSLSFFLFLFLLLFLLFCIFFSSSLIELEISFKKPRGDQRRKREVKLYPLRSQVGQVKWMI